LSFPGKHPWLIVLAVVVLGLALLWWFSPWHRDLRAQNFRFLPPDGVFAIHVDMAALRNTPLMGQALAQAPSTMETDYRAFLTGTGFNFEQDLDSIDIGVSGPASARVVNAVLVGRFHREKIDTYLAPRRKSTELHTSVNIDEFQGPSGRPLRLAFLGSGRMLFSNAPGPEPMRRMAELTRREGESLGDRLRALNVFSRVPGEVQVWLSADLERAGRITVPAPGSDASFTSDLLRGSRVALASAKVAGKDVELRLEAQYANAGDAARVSQSLIGLRALLRALAERRSPGKTTDWEKTLDQVTVSTTENNVALTLRVGQDFLVQLLKENAPTK
jgi:hypothetical protein